MIKGVRSGTIIKKSKNGSLEKVSNNLVDYLNMPEGGHTRYGMEYLFSQV